MKDVLPDLLQSYEHVLETLGRLVTVTQRLIDAQQRGETIASSVLEDYMQQLQNINVQRERLHAMLSGLWKTVGDEKTH